MECQFYNKAKYINCSLQMEVIGDENSAEKIIIFTECGLLPSSDLNLFICSNHYSYFLETNKKRKRRYSCQIPSLINKHKYTRTSDRTLSLENVSSINEKYGIVLPVGTGICRDCRRGLLQNQDNLVEASQEIQIEQVQDVDKNTSAADCLDEIPVKRTRKNASLAIEYSDLTTSTEGSQENECSQSSSVLCWSNACRLDAPREALNKFLDLSGLSPVKEMQGNISEASRRTQQRYIKKAAQCFDLICNTICPGEGDFIKSAIFMENTKEEDNSATLNTLVEIYKRADTWDFQRQFLSIIAGQHSFEDVKKLIPEVTQYKFKSARKHCNQVGIGEPVSKTKQTREKFDVGQLDHFIDFITSTHIIKDMPFGERTLKLNGGEVIKIPSVIRSLAPPRIIAQYTAVCKEENIKELGSSTLYKLLDECSALVRQSIEGLDNYVLEGCKAFKELESIVQQLDLTNIESKSLQENLQSAKRYLKSELKIHATRENRIADHCLSYALSSADINFKAACGHDHDLTCKDCVNIDTTLKCIKEKSETKEWKNKEATLYTVEESISAIRKWKCHVVRSRNQEEARCAIVEDMSSSDVVITCDWAMKFLPRKHREGQIDWFAKRGINWHIAVSLLKNQSSFTTITHIHIFENPTAQDSAITTQILVDISKDIMAHRDDINRIHFFSDNAGCYKSSSTLLTLQQELSSCIVSYNFCEAQNGKGPCDRRASHIKSVIKRYINEGNDVTTALQMKQAVDKEKKENLKVKVVTCLNILDETPRKCIIPNISQMYNFHFTERGLRMWKAFSVGEGRLLRWDYLGTPVKTIDLKTISDWMGGHISNTNEESQVVTDVSDSADQTSTISVMECPLESCTKTFHSRKALDEHILMGNCNLQGVKMNISEKAKRLYAEKILSIQPQRKIVLESGHNSASECLSLEMGWAIKESKQRVALTPCQKAYMVEKYNIGKVTGNKVDPYVAAEEMRNSGVFARSQYLSGQQISSFFSRMCQKEKK